MNRIRSAKGFTLIEMLVVVSLVALTGLCVFSMFNSAVDLMRRISRTVIEEDVAIFLEKIDREISNQVAFTGIPSEGESQKMSFFTPLENGRGVGKIRYFFNSSRNSFSRQELTLSHVFKEEEVSSSPMLEGVQDMSFKYLSYNEEEETYLWLPEWVFEEQEGKIPFAIRIWFNYVRGGEVYGFQRTVWIPIAQSTR